MKTKILSIALLYLLIYPFVIYCQEFDSNFKPIEPLLNKQWNAVFKTPDGARELTSILTYIPILKGTAIKIHSEVKELNWSGEGYFYWNDIEKKIAYFDLSSNGTSSEGFVSVEGKVITIEGTCAWPKPQRPPLKQSYNFKRTFEFIEDNKIIDKWFHNGNGQWEPGHVREHIASALK